MHLGLFVVQSVVLRLSNVARDLGHFLLIIAVDQLQLLAIFEGP